MSGTPTNTLNQAAMTELQRMRMLMDLPFEGAQPEIMRVRAYLPNPNGKDTPRPEYDEYFVNDGRYPATREQLKGVCILRAINLVETWPELKVMIMGAAEIDAQGQRVGKDFGSIMTIWSSDAATLKQQHATPELRKLANRISGEPTADKALARWSRDRLLVDYSGITESVCTRFRDAHFSEAQSAKLFDALHAEFSKPAPAPATPAPATATLPANMESLAVDAKARFNQCAANARPAPVRQPSGSSLRKY